MNTFEFNKFNMFHISFLVKLNKKAKIRNRYNQVPHLTRAIIWESDKTQAKHHRKENQECKI